MKKEPPLEEEEKRLEWRCLIWASEELLKERPKTGMVGEEVLEPFLVELAGEARRPEGSGLTDIRRGGVAAPEWLAEELATVAPKGIPPFEDRRGEWASSSSLRTKGAEGRLS